MRYRQGKRGGKKNIAKAKYSNCQKMGHFARECTKPKKVRPNTSSPNSFLCSHAFVVDSLLGWIVDYHRVSACNHYIAMGKDAQEEVLGIGTYQLKLSTRRELLLSDVQYAPNIRYGFAYLFWKGLLYLRISE
ncbi:UNVERIFIED_CONTAM: hypothetical protein Slati_2511800 [Sesamum latifolium]|uniref:CCHC-type domain-containing protein n=1 Tax=Sesamum latifolium TaxID=2727402 RepID=A0AAW2WFR5_9LAMI